MRRAVREAILARFEGCVPAPALRPDRRGYTRHPHDNLLPALDDRDILPDFRAGDGGELGGSVPGFCAAHSSSALAANAFGPFRTRPDRLWLAGMDGFVETRFEVALPTGLKGTPPSLDFFASGPRGSVAVASKFTEPLTPKRARFAPSYARAVEALADPAWTALYRTLLDEPTLFGPLDAAQLVKHYLGIRHALAERPGRRVLLYAFWEPANAAVIPESVAHRAAVEAFAERVRGGEVEFVARSYEELWREQDAASSWPGQAAHLAALRARYGVTVEVTAS